MNTRNQKDPLVYQMRAGRKQSPLRRTVESVREYSFQNTEENKHILPMKQFHRRDHRAITANGCVNDYIQIPSRLNGQRDLSENNKDGLARPRQTKTCLR